MLSTTVEIFLYYLTSGCIGLEHSSTTVEIFLYYLTNKETLYRDKNLQQ